MGKQQTVVFNHNASEKGLKNKALSELTDIPVSSLEKLKNKLLKNESIKSSSHFVKLKDWTVNPNDRLWYQKEAPRGQKSEGRQEEGV